MLWISIEECPPSPYEEVVFFDNHRHNPCVKIGYSTYGAFVSHGESYYNVTHWMPMPEPPEMEKE